MAEDSQKPVGRVQSTVGPPQDELCQACTDRKRSAVSSGKPSPFRDQYARGPTDDFSVVPVPAAEDLVALVLL